MDRGKDGTSIELGSEASANDQESFEFVGDLSVNTASNSSSENDTAVCNSLVREYLFRRGHLRVLQKFDEEMVRLEGGLCCIALGTLCASYDFSLQQEGSNIVPRF